MTTTELGYIKRPAFLKEVKNQNLRNFDLGSHESMNFPIWIIIGLQL